MRNHQSVAWCTMPTTPWAQASAGSGSKPETGDLPAQDRGDLLGDPPHEVGNGLAGLPPLPDGPMHEEVVDLAVLLDEPDVRVDGCDQALARVVGAVQGPVELAQEGAGVALRQRPVEASLVAEVAIENHPRDARLGGDPIHRGRWPMPADDSIGGVEELGLPLAPPRLSSGGGGVFGAS